MIEWPVHSSPRDSITSQSHEHHSTNVGTSAPPHPATPTTPMTCSLVAWSMYCLASDDTAGVTLDEPLAWGLMALEATLDAALGFAAGGAGGVVVLVAVRAADAAAGGGVVSAAAATTVGAPAAGAAADASALALACAALPFLDTFLSCDMHR